MPRSKKPPGTAVDPRNGQHVALPGSSSRLAQDRVPLPPRGLTDQARQLWDDYWSDPQSPAHILTPADTFPAMRWIDAVDRYLRLMYEADERPTVKGSTGQSVRNPLYDIADRALAVVERAEQQLGIGAMNRVRLGIAVITEQRSLAQMNADVMGGEDAEQDGGTAGEADQVEDDPRVVDIDAPRAPRRRRQARSS